MTVKTWKITCRLLYLIIAALYACNSLGYESPYQLEVFKSSRELHLKQDGKIIKVYRIAHGKGRGITKRIRGDGITPVGNYRITNFKSNSKFHFFMHIDYPNLLDAWYGYKNHLITSNEFKAIATAINDQKLPPQDTALGSHIGIHGIGESNDEKISLHKVHNWTEGCIALLNDEVNELRQFVSVGTKVFIRN